MRHAKIKPYITTRSGNGPLDSVPYIPRAKPTHTVTVEWLDVHINKRYAAIALIRKYVHFNTASSLERSETDFNTYDHKGAIDFQKAIEAITNQRINTHIGVYTSHQS